MSKLATFTSVRIIPRDAGFLDRRVGSKGEIFYDQSSNSLRLYDSIVKGGIALAKADLSNVPNQTFLQKAQDAGITAGGLGSSSFDLSIAAEDSTLVPIISGNTIQFTGGAGITTSSTEAGEIVITNTNNSFSAVNVSGQNNLTAGQLSDTLNLVAGSNITLTTDDTTNSITIDATSSGPSSNSFTTISIATQSDVVADSSTDTLNLVAGTGIAITTNPTTDTITITNTVSSFAFSQLSDVTSLGINIDQVYLPAITMLTVTNSGASAYRFDQYGSVNNPTVYAINGTTIAFKLTASGHPFLIQTGAGTNYNIGLIHVATDGTVSTGASAQGKDSGTLYWKIPTDISGGYRYQCSIHAPMVGSITIKVFSTL